MSGKRPNIPVADWNDDGTSKIVGADKLRAQWDEHKTRPPPAKGQKLSTIEILQYLAVAKRSLEPDEPNARIPAALIDAIALRIASKRQWVRAEAAAKRSKAALRRRLLCAEADKVRAEHPHWNVSDVARAVIKRLNGQLDGVQLKFQTVRQQISAK